ncbi:MAG: HNH endonuclease [Deltaproteobacteria bacterium]|nr:HNH endonuclease [Deltaproteobacteria bacterium]
MDAAVRHLVRQRAGEWCEYCRLPQDAVEATFHIEHIVALQHGGQDDPSNLALACDRCNLYKGPNLTSIDSESGAIVLLFHPRQDTWQDHFVFRGPRLIGLTSRGRATVQLLNMNAPRRIQLRIELQATGTM